LRHKSRRNLDGQSQAAIIQKRYNMGMRASIKQGRRAIRRSLFAIARSYLILMAIFAVFLFLLGLLVVGERFLIGLV
jgi:hypothetical protein